MIRLLDVTTFSAGVCAFLVAATTRNPGLTLLAFFVGLVAGIVIGRWTTRASR